MLYSWITPFLFRLDAERAHRLSIAALKLAMLPRGRIDDRLQSELAGIRFPGPVGLAAGFDKNGEVAHRMAALGFGFAELGTLTPLPQDGNPRPRLFRLQQDRAVINRMGFNNDGQAVAAARLTAIRDRAGKNVIGVNIGANKDSPDRIADYAAGVRTMSHHADYLTANVSSPNTPGLRQLQDAGALDALLSGMMATRATLPEGERRPIFLKVAPDLEKQDIAAITRLCIDHRVDALIVSNTTVSRPPLRSSHAGEGGGLSGAPLHDLALEKLRAFRVEAGRDLPLIGAGGIATAEQAYARIRAGAALVQLYSALVYEGPWLAARINQGLVRLLDRDGLASISDAIGLDAPN